VIVLTNLAGGPSQLLAEQLMSDMLSVPLFSGDDSGLDFPASLPFTTNHADISAAEKKECSGKYVFGKSAIAVEPAEVGIVVTQPRSEYSSETVSTRCMYLGDNFFMGRQPGGFPMIQFVKDGEKVTHLLSGGNKFKKA
jgi:hypothetical protein